MLGRKCLKKSALILIVFILLFQVFALIDSNNFLNNSHDLSDQTVLKSFTTDLYITTASREIRNPLSSTNSGRSTLLIGAIILFVIIIKIFHLSIVSLIIDLREAITCKISIYFHGSKYKDSYSIC